MIIDRLKSHLVAYRERNRIRYLNSWVYPVSSPEAFYHSQHWKKEPIISEEAIFEYQNDTHLNFRRLMDAKVLLGACCNENPARILEIGTASGQTTANMSENAPSSEIFTINIPPEEIEQGGKYSTYAPSYDEIGKAYRDRGFTNVKQIYANTANWEPDIEGVDIAFIDGSHDSDFVFNDTVKVLKCMKPGGLILWHDFNPQMVEVHSWIKSVCLGVCRLYEEGVLRKNLFHLRDSWMGFYRV